MKKSKTNIDNLLISISKEIKMKKKILENEGIGTTIYLDRKKSKTENINYKNINWINKQFNIKELDIYKETLSEKIEFLKGLIDEIVDRKNHLNKKI